MKKYITIASLIVSALIVSADETNVVSTTLQVPLSIPTNALPDKNLFIAGAMAAKQISVTVYPSYAPGLKDKSTGKNSQFGFGAAILYPTTDHTFVGVRVDEMLGQTFAGQASGGFNYGFTLWGKDIEAFALGGVIASQTGDIGAVVGAGVDMNLWTNSKSNISVNVFAAYDRWIILDNINMFHAGPVVTFKF